MAMKLYSDSDISDIADAIRSKNGSSDTYKVSEMASAISAIPSGGITPTGTKSITANGTGIDVYSYQYADVAVPNSYSASDEGKVVSNGALVAQTSDTVTQNDTYDTTLINSLTVNVSGGGGITADSLIDGSFSGVYSSTDVTSLRAGAFYKNTGLTGINLPNVTIMRAEAFLQCTNLVHLYLPKADFPDNYTSSICNGCSNLETVVLPSVTKQFYSQCFYNCTKLKSIDTTATGSSGGNVFVGSTVLDTLVLRHTSVFSLGNIAFFNNTPFASGKTGGTLYVPSALISSYQSASNWSTILGYTNNQIKSIESTHTDPTAPIDLTLYYADGTAIPTT